MNIKIKLAIKECFKVGVAKKVPETATGIFIKCIKFQFNTGMSRENYGMHWELDHVMPILSFNLKDVGLLCNAFNWANDAHYRHYNCTQHPYNHTSSFAMIFRFCEAFRYLILYQSATTKYLDCMVRLHGSQFSIRV
jgi:hypothetical protein